MVQLRDCVLHVFFLFTVFAFLNFFFSVVFAGGGCFIFLLLGSSGSFGTSHLFNGLGNARKLTACKDSFRKNNQQKLNRETFQVLSKSHRAHSEHMM